MPVVNRWLTAAVLVAACLAGLGAAIVWRTHGDRADDRVREERYGAVLAAANAEATAFVNLRYDRAHRSVAAVAHGATGEFRRRYESSSGHVVKVMRQHRSVLTGKVVWSGVVDVDPRRATAIVATTGTVANVSTHGRAVPRTFRLKLALVHRGGRWLTSDVQFVGGAR